MEELSSNLLAIDYSTPVVNDSRKTSIKSNSLKIPHLIHHRRSAGFDLIGKDLYSRDQSLLNVPELRPRRLSDSIVNKRRSSTRNYHVMKVQNNSINNIDTYGCDGSFSPRTETEEYFFKRSYC